MNIVHHKKSLLRQFKPDCNILDDGITRNHMGSLEKRHRKANRTNQNEVGICLYSINQFYLIQE
jgi:hypothetical protein